MRHRSRLLRPTVALASLLLATAGLVACSSSDDADTTTESSAASGETTDQFPVTISGGKFGEVTIEEAPQRVVALGWGDAETALALGVQPIGASDWLAFGGEGVGPWAEGLYDTPPEIIPTTEPSIESIAALEPDLILDTRASGDQARYDSLANIGVPVVSIPEGGDNYVTTWEQQLDIVGQALGRTEKADELKTEFEDKIAATKTDNPQFEGKTVAVGARFGESYGAYVSGDSRVDFMKALGFVQKPELDALSSGDFYVPVAGEQLVLFDADLTVMFPIGLEASVITGDPVFQAVPSVQAGHDIVFDDKTVSDAFSSGTTLGLSYAIDQAVPQFSEALAR